MSRASPTNIQVDTPPVGDASLTPVKDDVVRPDPHFSRDTYEKALIRVKALKLRSFNEYVNQLVIADVTHQAAESIRVEERMNQDVVKIRRRKDQLGKVINSCLVTMDPGISKEVLREQRGEVLEVFRGLYFSKEVDGTVQPYNILEVLPKLRAMVEERKDAELLQRLDAFVDFLRAQDSLWRLKQDTIAVRFTHLEPEAPKSAVDQFTEGTPLPPPKVTIRTVHEPAEDLPSLEPDPEEPLAFLYKAPSVSKDRWEKQAERS